MKKKAVSIKKKKKIIRQTRKILLRRAPAKRRRRQAGRPIAAALARAGNSAPPPAENDALRSSLETVQSLSLAEPKSEIKETGGEKMDVINNVSDASASPAAADKPSLAAIPFKVVSISLGEHDPSPHLLTLRQTADEPPLKLTQPLYAKAVRRSRLFFWLNELSVLSFLGLILLAVDFAAKHVFRVPLLEIQQSLSGDSAEYKALNGRVKEAKREAKRAALSAPIVLASEFRPLPVTADKKAPWLFLRPLAAAAIAGIIILMPLRIMVEIVRLKSVRAEVVSAAAQGLSSFVAGGQAVIDYDFFRAGEEFQSAVVNFEQASQALEDLPAVLRILAAAAPDGRQFASGQALISAGAALSRVGQKISQDFIFLKSSSAPIINLSASDILNSLSSAALTIKPDIDEATAELNNVSQDDLPPEYQPAFAQLRLLMPSVQSAVNQLAMMGDIAADLLGVDERRHYLVMFQNNNELRPSGGFMGSYAIVDVKDGQIQLLKVPGGGTYDLQGSLIPRLLAPEPLRLINPRWEFQDANWWSDWPASAKKIQWFYQQAGGESVDGVIALDVDLIEALLEISGPIYVPAYNLTVTSQNFAMETQAEVELRYDRAANRPKQFIADLAPLLVGRLESEMDKNGLRLAAIISRALTEKHLLIYRNQADIENRLRDLGWAGEISKLAPYTDTVGIVHTNIAGGKTDRVISDEIEHRAVSSLDGTLTDTLLITRRHGGNKGEQFSGVRNVDYLRVYVPPGSRLLSAAGFQPPDQSLFDIPASDLELDDDLRHTSESIKRDSASGVISYDELGRTVFAGWLIVDPGESVTAELVYELPWRSAGQINNSWQSWSSYLGWTENVQFYRWRWEKQPGTTGAAVKHSFVNSRPLHIKASSANVQASDYGWSWQSVISADEDLYVAYVNDYQ